MPTTRAANFHTAGPTITTIATNYTLVRRHSPTGTNSSRNHAGIGEAAGDAGQHGAQAEHPRPWRRPSGV